MDYESGQNIDWRHKGFPTSNFSSPVPSLQQSWNVLAGDFQLPLLVIKESAVNHNLDVVHGFCKKFGFSIAPHGKTTMSPELIGMQLNAGSWAITAATVSQAKILREFGVPRILIASQVVEPSSIQWLADQLHDDQFEIICLVDSAEVVNLMDHALSTLDPARKIKVLLELGILGGRTGCRSQDDVSLTASAIRNSKHLVLAGIETYEGVAHYDTEGMATVDALLESLFATAVDLDQTGHFDAQPEIILSAGGSVFPDRVALKLSQQWTGSRPIRIVLRSGCYITHDHGFYDRVGPFGTRIESNLLQPALEVWGAVISAPEEGLVLLNFGKRDVAYDIDLPKALHILPRGSNQPKSADGIEIFELNDQHAYARVAQGVNLEIGDLVAAGISHPCTAFDKWRSIPMVDDEYNMKSIVTTYF
jgi:D-serine dehydratase